MTGIGILVKIVNIVTYIKCENACELLDKTDNVSDEMTELKV
jgi:hypothetical protein